MCGIAGIIYRDGSHPPTPDHHGAHRLGADMTRMLQSMKHRGPDSTGYALYRRPANDLIMRIKLADGGANGDIEYADRLRHRRREVEARLRAAGARVDSIEDVNDYTIAVTLGYGGELKRVADYVESVPGAEVLSAGSALEIIKDLGDAQTVGTQYKLDGYIGTHGIGHVRMATESDVDISNAHPYWAYPFSDVAVVHNGQLTNYHQWRRRLERLGHRFASDCDSEIIAVYLAQKMAEGATLEQAMRQSLEDLDGVFTYICVSDGALGMAKDELAAKPLVLYEGDDMVVLASEEIAIRAVIDREIETYDPYESEVMVWTR
jgi:methylamine---glutamate N-methyltransferase subunit A